MPLGEGAGRPIRLRNGVKRAHDRARAMMDRERLLSLLVLSFFSAHRLLGLLSQTRSISFDLPPASCISYIRRILWLRDALIRP